MQVKDLMVALTQWAPDAEVLIEQDWELVPLTRLTPQLVLVTGSKYQRWCGSSPVPKGKLTTMVLYVH